MVSGLRRSIEVMEKGMMEWGIGLNVEKAKLLIISSNTRNGNRISKEMQCERVEIGNKIVIAKKEIKYMGVILDGNNSIGGVTYKTDG